ncbi:MAPEG family protein [Erythrobacter rubeus]|uniref:MAPEG family protein n=1 Tax=Erythrobacter rubeus TaxID=2760803 RepID=A0ABR8KXG9_9SPHN|nr:MAPEG family protein [Erythrobacter rubeus]MBD2842922.1 MAPEG family protein [Erythrobacter rubeus]
MNLPVYTAALGAFVIVLQVALMLSVGFHRTKGQFIGLGEDRDLERKVRRHGNLAENSGLFLVVIALFEMLVGQTTYVLVLCLAFAVARLLHAFGFSSLAGSHGDDLTGARKAFAGMRAMGAFGTLGVALGSAFGIASALA